MKEQKICNSPLLDTRARPVRDLRISITDRCNFRCVYCMPRTAFGADHQFLARDDLLSFEEITRLTKLFADRGVLKVRLTGGEPLLRRDVERLIELLANIPSVEVALTTNGSLLAKRAKSLRDAGLSRITVSLDALDDVVFRRMNDADFPVARVLEGIDAAASVGLTPIKINTVVKRGTNENEMLPLARHFRGSGHILRFIEYMDVGSSNQWNMKEVIPSSEVVRRISAEFPLEPVDPNYTGEVAERWRYRDGAGEIGVISSVTQAFCATCSRARLSTEGKIYTCLFANQGHDLRALLRTGRSDEELAAALDNLWRQRTDRYSEIRNAELSAAKKIEMSYIGG
ncbi:MAG: GTP 3',8-cyclase MoaA [Rhodocyclaceae bacterium]|nr:GTP 3',8-cyclase MoaA [Rhodocyclaceae bacterium]